MAGVLIVEEIRPPADKTYIKISAPLSNVQGSAIFDPVSGNTSVIMNNFADGEVPLEKMTITDESIPYKRIAIANNQILEEKLGPISYDKIVIPEKAIKLDKIDIPLASIHWNKIENGIPIHKLAPVPYNKLALNDGDIEVSKLAPIPYEKIVINKHQIPLDHLPSSFDYSMINVPDEAIELSKLPATIPFSKVDISEHQIGWNLLPNTVPYEMVEIADGQIDISKVTIPDGSISLTAFEIDPGTIEVDMSAALIPPASISGASIKTWETNYMHYMPNYILPGQQRVMRQRYVTSMAEDIKEMIPAACFMRISAKGGGNNSSQWTGVHINEMLYESKGNFNVLVIGGPTGRYLDDFHNQDKLDAVEDWRLNMWHAVPQESVILANTANITFSNNTNTIITTDTGGITTYTDLDGNTVNTVNATFIMSEDFNAHTPANNYPILRFESNTTITTTDSNTIFTDSVTGNTINTMNVVITTNKWVEKDKPYLNKNIQYGRIIYHEGFPNSSTGRSQASDAFNLYLKDGNYVIFWTNGAGAQYLSDSMSALSPRGANYPSKFAHNLPNDSAYYCIMMGGVSDNHHEFLYDPPFGIIDEGYSPEGNNSRAFITYNNFLLLF
jgi:hypothetical protein